MKKLYFITNLQSGKSAMRSKLASVIDIFTAGGWQVTVRTTQARMDACAAAEYACLSKEFDLIVCSGGDGTLNEVVQGLMYSRNPLPLGYIPCGVDWRCVCVPRSYVRIEWKRFCRWYVHRLV